MKNITALFQQLYYPAKALLIYAKKEDTQSVYVESLDISGKGFPINAHPLSVAEAQQLADSLRQGSVMHKRFLATEILLPDNLLYLQQQDNGCAVWYTPPQQTTLHFTEALHLSSGTAWIPALVWKANKEQLFIYAIKENRRPTLDTVLFHAPFFNCYTSGNVCMGTVEVAIDDQCSLGDFIDHWQHYFFSSVFSHLLEGHDPVKGNIVQLWQQLIGTGKKFPLNVLKKTQLTLKNLLP